MIPGQPGEPISRGRQSRRGRSRGRSPGCVRARFPAGHGYEVDGNDCIDRLTVRRVILAHADPAPAAGIDHAIGEPPVPSRRWRRWSERLRLGSAGCKPVESTVGEIREIDRSFPHQPRPAPVLVHARAHIEGRRSEVGRLRKLSAAHHDAAPLLLRPAFQPMDVVSVQPRTSDSPMDCATMRSEVIGDLQEPYGAVLTERGDMLTSLPVRCRLGRCPEAYAGTMIRDRIEAMLPQRS